MSNGVLRLEPAEGIRIPSRFTPTRIIIGACLVAIYLWAVDGTGFNLSELVQGAPEFARILGMMLPPSMKNYEGLVQPALETVYIGFLATIIGAVLAIPFGLLGARNFMPPHVYYPARMILNVLRGISELVWALLFVVAIGLGPMAGVLALIMFTVGYQGKLLSEAVEAANPGPIEALSAAGAGRGAQFWVAVLPQVFPLYLSQALYLWDHNTRAATILGVVGAGGLGVKLLWHMSMYEFEQVSTCILVIIIMITAIDSFSKFVRGKVL